MILSAFAWGTWALAQHHTGARSAIEFGKYGENQFIRCRALLWQWDTDRLIGGI